MKAAVLGALATGLFAQGPVQAQEGGTVTELVVTAQRADGGGGATPHVMVFRRADNLIVNAQVDCDTRDRTERIGEMKATLHNMIAAAAASGGRIELGVDDDDVILPLQAERLDSIPVPGRREDTTTTTIVVKTRILASDSFDGAAARIADFISKTKVEGRAQVMRTGEWELTLVNPRQYRQQIVAAIAQDADETLKAFGPGYGVEIQGLEGPVDWSRAGPLSLSLFIPYRLKIEPVASH